MRRIYPHTAEQLVVDVAVQLLHQLQAAQTCVHLQKHQRYLALRGEVRSATAFRSHTPAQSQILCYLTERQLLLDSFQFALLERLSVQIIKIILCKREIGGYSSEIFYLCHADLFLRHLQKQLFKGSWRYSFYPLLRYEYSIILAINLLQIFIFLRQSLMYRSLYAREEKSFWACTYPGARESTSGSASLRISRTEVSRISSSPVLMGSRAF